MKTDILNKYLKENPQNRRIVIIVLCSIVAVCMIVGSELLNKDSGKQKTGDSVQISDSDYEINLEKRLTEIISEIDGVGKVKVMVKTSGSVKSEFAVNDTVSNSSDGNVRYDNEYVVIKDSSAQQGMLIKQSYPEIQGVIVVCQGGADSKVVYDVTDAVSALTGIGKSSISVTKMKGSEEQR